MTNKLFLPFTLILFFLSFSCLSKANPPLFNDLTLEEAVNAGFLLPTLTRKIESPSSVTFEKTETRSDSVRSDSMVRERFYLDALKFEIPGTPEPYLYQDSIRDSNAIGAKIKTVRLDNGQYNYGLCRIFPEPLEGGERNGTYFVDSFTREPFEEIAARAHKAHLLFKDGCVMRPTTFCMDRLTLCSERLFDSQHSVFILTDSGNVTCGKANFVATLVKSPGGIRLRPADPTSTWIQEIHIYPFRFSYPSARQGGGVCYSETCRISGTVDFSANQMNLQVLNGFMSVTFFPKALDPSLPLRIDAERLSRQTSIVRALVNQAVLEQSRLEELKSENFYKESLAAYEAFMHTKSAAHWFIAEELLSEVIRNASKPYYKANALYHLGLMYLEDEKTLSKALMNLRLAKELEHHKAEEKFREVEQYKKEKDKEEEQRKKKNHIERLYTKALEFRDNPDQDVDYENAIKLFNKVLARDSKHVKAMHNLGMIYWKLNDIEQAKKWFEKAQGLGFEPSIRNLARMQKDQTS